MEKPYLVFKNGLFWRRRKTMAFAIKDMKALNAAGFSASIAEEINPNKLQEAARPKESLC